VLFSSGKENRLSWLLIIFPLCRTGSSVKRFGCTPEVTEKLKETFARHDVPDARVWFQVTERSILSTTFTNFFVVWLVSHNSSQGLCNRHFSREALSWNAPFTTPVFGVAKTYVTDLCSNTWLCCVVCLILWIAPTKSIAHSQLSKKETSCQIVSMKNLSANMLWFRT